MTFARASLSGSSAYMVSGLLSREHVMVLSPYTHIIHTTKGERDAVISSQEDLLPDANVPLMKRLNPLKTKHTFCFSLIYFTWDSFIADIHLQACWTSPQLIFHFWSWNQSVWGWHLFLFGSLVKWSKAVPSETSNTDSSPFVLSGKCTLVAVVKPLGEYQGRCFTQMWWGQILLGLKVSVLRLCFLSGAQSINTNTSSSKQIN